MRNSIIFTHQQILLGRWLSSGLYRRVVWYKFTNVSEVLAASIIALMMEAARTFETLLNFYQTIRCYNPEDSYLRTHRRENLISYKYYKDDKIKEDEMRRA
jgi:hypothetical protein